MELENHQYKLTDKDNSDILLRNLQFIFGSLSIFGTTVVFLIILINKNKLSPALELIFYLCTVSLLNCISYMINFIPTDKEYENNGVCQFQAFLMLITEFSEVFICTSILFYIYNTLSEVKQGHILNKRKRFLFIGCSVGFSFIITSTCLMLNVLGPSGNWCWIIHKDHPNFVRAFYVTMWCFLILDLVISILILTSKHKPNVQIEELKNRKEYACKLIRYPIISILCWIPATIMRAAFDELQDSWLNIFASIIMLTEGFLFFIASANTLEYRKVFNQCFNKLNYKSTKINDTNSSISDLDNYLSPKESVIIIDGKESNSL